MKQIIISVGPKRPYIYQELKTLEVDDIPIIFMMDSPSDLFPECNLENIIKFGHKDEEKLPPRKLAARNYIRCLQLASGKDTLIIEDDLKFVKNWRKEFQTCIDSIKDEQYVLSLGNHHWLPDMIHPDLIDHEFHKEVIQKETKKQPIVLALTHARYFTSGIDVRVIIAYIEKLSINANLLYDQALDLCLMKNKVKLFTSAKPLVYHLGKISGLGESYHE